MHRLSSLNVVLATVLVTTATACDTAAGPGLELMVARQQWAQQGPSSYSITLLRSCECTEDMSGPVIVTVEDGVVASRVYVRNSAPVPAGFAGNFPPVEGLFELIEDARSRRVAQLDVRFDGTYGYPTRIWIDENEVTADDEFGYTATNFTLP